MSDHTHQNRPSPERVERSIIRRIGKTRYAKLCMFLQEDVDVSFLLGEFSLEHFEIQAIRQLISAPATKKLRTQTN